MNLSTTYKQACDGGRELLNLVINIIIDKNINRNKRKKRKTLLKFLYITKYNIHKNTSLIKCLTSL